MDHPSSDSFSPWPLKEKKETWLVDSLVLDCDRVTLVSVFLCNCPSRSGSCTPTWKVVNGLRFLKLLGVSSFSPASILSSPLELTGENCKRLQCLICLANLIINRAAIPRYEPACRAFPCDAYLFSGFLPSLSSVGHAPLISGRAGR